MERDHHVLSVAARASRYAFPAATSRGDGMRGDGRMRRERTGGRRRHPPEKGRAGCGHRSTPRARGNSEDGAEGQQHPVIPPTAAAGRHPTAAPAGAGRRTPSLLPRGLAPAPEESRRRDRHDAVSWTMSQEDVRERALRPHVLPGRGAAVRSAASTARDRWRPIIQLRRREPCERGRGRGGHAREWGARSRSPSAS